MFRSRSCVWRKRRTKRDRTEISFLAMGAALNLEQANGDACLRMCWDVERLLRATPPFYPFLLSPSQAKRNPTMTRTRKAAATPENLNLTRLDLWKEDQPDESPASVLGRHHLSL